MREILFRGRCTGEDDIYGWVDGFYVRLRDSYKKRESHRIYTGFAECDCGSFYGDCYEVDPETVGQFTGLFDKNGKRIFEGDIVLYRNESAGVVSFVDGAFGVRFGDGTSAMFLCFAAEHSVIIGNIHDDKELVKVYNLFTTY